MRTREAIESDIEAVQYNIDTFDVSAHVTDKAFREYLDETYPEVGVAGLYTTSLSTFLKECSPITYRVMFADYCGTIDERDCEDYVDLENQLEELEQELNDLEES